MEQHPGLRSNHRHSQVPGPCSVLRNGIITPVSPGVKDALIRTRRAILTQYVFPFLSVIGLVACYGFCSGVQKPRLSQGTMIGYTDSPRKLRREKACLESRPPSHRTHACVHAHVHTHTHTHTHARAHKHTHIHVRSSTHKSIYITQGHPAISYALRLAEQRSQISVAVQITAPHAPRGLTDNQKACGTQLN